MFHDIDSGFIGWCGLMHRLFLRYQTSTMHNLSHQRITLPSWGIKEVIRVARRAAEITDNALRRLLNRVDEKKKILFAHHLKGKCNYLSANQHLALTSCVWPCWTRNHGNFFLSLIEHSLVIQKLACVCVCGDEQQTRAVFHVFLTPGHLGNSLILPFMAYHTVSK